MAIVVFEFLSRLLVQIAVEKFSLENVGKVTEYDFRDDAIRWQMSKSANDIFYNFDFRQGTTMFQALIFSLKKDYLSNTWLRMALPNSLTCDLVTRSNLE